MLGYLAYRGARGAAREYGRSAKQFAKSPIGDKKAVFVIMATGSLAFAVLGTDTGSFYWVAAFAVVCALVCRSIQRNQTQAAQADAQSRQQYFDQEAQKRANRIAAMRAARPQSWYSDRR